MSKEDNQTGDKTDVKSDEKTISEDIPLWQKYTLSVEEAAKYFQIGRAKLRRLIDENINAPYILWSSDIIDICSPFMAQISLS